MVFLGILLLLRQTLPQRKFCQLRLVQVLARLAPMPLPEKLELHCGELLFRDQAL